VSGCGTKGERTLNYGEGFGSHEVITPLAGSECSHELTLSGCGQLFDRVCVDFEIILTMTLREVVVATTGVWIAVKIVSGVQLAPLDPLSAIGTLLVVGLIIVVVNTLAAPIRQFVRIAAGTPTRAIVASLLLNAIVFWICAWFARTIGLGFSVTGFGAALAASIVIAVVAWLVAPLLVTQR